MKRAVVLAGIALLLGAGALGFRLRPTPASAVPPQPAPLAATLSPTPSTAAPELSPAAPVSAEQARNELLALLAAPNPLRRWADLERCLGAWSQLDAPAALAFVQQAPRFPQRTAALAIPLAALARTDPAVTAAWIRSYGTAADRLELVNQVVSTVADESPRAALFLLGAEGLPAPSHLLGYALGRLVLVAPDEATALLATLPAADRNQAAMLIGTNWAERDPAAALRWCATLRGQPDESAAAESVLLRLCDTDPAAAAQALVQLQPPAEAAAATIRALADTDPELALRTVSQLAGDPRAQAAQALAEAAFGTAPDRIVALARGALSPADFATALRDGWNGWRDSDRPAAEAWAAGVTDPALRSQLTELALADAAHADPALFLSAVEAAPDAPPSREALATALTNLPTAEAARWLAAHPTLAAPGATAQIAESFARDDRDAADTWAQTLPAGEARDRALATVAGQWSGVRETARAGATLDRIADPVIRTAGTYQVFTTLHGADPEAARNWLATQPLSEEVRASWEAIVIGSEVAPATEGDE